MNHPIPRPKKMTYTGSTVPAAFFAGDYDPVFEPALGVFRRYARRAFGDAADTGGTLTLVLEPGMGDGYRISIREKTVLTASNNTGMNYAFATLLQLAEKSEAGVVFPTCEITDQPDNHWRGVMLDLSRCYHEAEYLFAVADLCWFYKISRFQLHFTDDQAVRFPFSAVPKAVAPEHYSKQELSDLADYCRERGIVIVPEIDAPGHFYAFIKAYPDLFRVKPDSSSEETEISSIMRLQETCFETLQAMYTEVAQVFVDSPWIHIGGDEANIAAWSTCPISDAYREEHGLKDVHELYGHCVARLARMVLDLGRIPVVWEGFSEECNHMIPKETLVFAWESYYQIAPALLRGGFEIINASWQPLYIVSPARMWDPDEILKWEKNIWRNWWEKSAAYAAPVTVPEDSPVAGGQICVWCDCMQPAFSNTPRQDMLREEFANLRVRLPALAQKVWTSYDSPDAAAFMEDVSLHDKLLAKLLP